MFTRRRILVPAIGAFLAAAFGGGLAGARALLRATRPAPSGTSATRCAQCGATDHGMLDRRCPLAPKVLS
ncbi:MAG TPA: hypothetical protein VFV20_01250 [Candidatus Limnocylindria bacterium]|nr:hypothetical protein [Candidatus Limnocylindria bacterium]